MKELRIDRERAVRVAAVAGLVVLGLSVLPGLLKTPEAPELPSDVGFTAAETSPGTLLPEPDKAIKPPVRKHEPSPKKPEKPARKHKKEKRAARDTSPRKPASKSPPASRSAPAPAPVSAPAAPSPAPAPAPAPSPAPSPPPPAAPAPSPRPGDGSQEFAPR